MLPEQPSSPPPRHSTGMAVIAVAVVAVLVVAAALWWAAQPDGQSSASSSKPQINPSASSRSTAAATVLSGPIGPSSQCAEPVPANASATARAYLAAVDSLIPQRVMLNNTLQAEHG